jgi:CheY-like chemotaxis protein
VGEGSTFSVFLPLHRASLVTRVLPVDDDARNSFAMTAALERMSVDVVDAQSGAAALASLEPLTDVDLVLMDIAMPVMNGYETAARIRAIPGCGDLPVIAATGSTRLGEQQRCLAAGASDYLAKPVDSGALRAILTKWAPTAQPATAGA